MHHRITVESLSGRSPIVREFGNLQEAEQHVDQAKLDRDSWHILHEMRQSQEAAPIIRLSLYRLDIDGWCAVRDDHQDPQRERER